MNNNEELKKGGSVFFIELNKIEANPFQPRIEFDEEKLNALAESIKQYGVLQPIVVSRKEEYSEEFGIKTKYQIIAGERRFRASKIAGLNSIPAIIREKEDTDAEKLELAIIENLQREDLNPVDKAKAFKKLADDFGLKHVEIAKKMGKSREYVSNAMRILMLPDNMLGGLMSGKISEGHTRSLLMLKDRLLEQEELYKRIVNDKLTVRAAEKIAREIAIDKVRKKVDVDPEIKSIEKNIREKLGTKVSIDQKAVGDGGKLTIEYFNKEDLRKILAVIESSDSITSSRDLDSNTELNNFEDIQPTVFKEEIDKIEQFGNVIKDEKINNFPSSEGENNKSLESKHEKEIDDTRNEIEKELVKLNLDNSFPKEKNVINEYSVEDKKIDGLEKIEIKNDFDKSRVEALKKSDEILKSFGAAPIVKNTVQENTPEADNFQREKVVQKIEINEEEAGENISNDSQNEYSDLYSQFLKSKKEIQANDAALDKTMKANMEPEIVLNSGEMEEIVVKDEPEIISESFGDFAKHVDGIERFGDIVETEGAIENSKINAEVDIISGDTDGFLADVKTDEEKIDSDIGQEEEGGDKIVKKDDNFGSFQGFSI